MNNDTKGAGTRACACMMLLGAAPRAPIGLCTGGFTVGCMLGEIRGPVTGL